MTARATAAARTGRAIEEAAVWLFMSEPVEAVTLEQVATRAGVTLQTVLRRFGSKQRLFESVAASLVGKIFEERAVHSASDVKAMVSRLVASYESMGQLNWRALCQEKRFEPVHASLREARARHRTWVAASFAELLPRASRRERECDLLQLFIATDFYVYKLLRRDLGYGRKRTIEAITDLVSRVLTPRRGT